jgi:uncharacterized cofD-like protein
MSAEALQPYRIVIGGGGTGANVLAEAANRVQTPDGREVIVSTVNVATDDGGSTGVLRRRPLDGIYVPGQEFYMGAVGDLRQSIAALSPDPEKARDVLNDRGICGHAIGNLMIRQATKQANGNLTKGVAAVAARMGIKGQVIPATSHPEAQIELITSDGRRIRGEHDIDTMDINDPGARVEVTHGKLTDEAHEAIAESDLFILAMGSPYASQQALTAVPGYADAVNEQGMRGGMYVTYANPTLEDHITVRGEPPHIVEQLKALESYTPDRAFDLAFYNNDLSLIPTDKLERALRIDDIGFGLMGIRAIGSPLIARTVARFNPNDKLAAAGQRQNMRHDQPAITGQLESIVLSHMPVGTPAYV